MKQIPGGVTAPKGFTASGVHCGVKKGKGDGNQPPMSKMPEVCNIVYGMPTQMLTRMMIIFVLVTSAGTWEVAKLRGVPIKS